MNVTDKNNILKGMNPKKLEKAEDILLKLDKETVKEARIIMINQLLKDNDFFWCENCDNWEHTTWKRDGYDKYFCDKCQKMIGWEPA